MADKKEPPKPKNGGSKDPIGTVRRVSKTDKGSKDTIGTKKVTRTRPPR
jgi:hypothetical protein